MRKNSTQRHKNAEKLWMAAQQTVLTLATPILLCIISVRLVMTPLFLQAVYHMPGFPNDLYGFTLEDRLTYARYPLAYLFNDDDISYLGRQRLPKDQCMAILHGVADCAMFNERELRHMRDVKTVTQYAFTFSVAAGGLVTLLGLGLWRDRARRGILRRGFLSGGILTIGAVAAIAFSVVFNWDFFFTTFHTTFFESGTWRFEYSDTLIRLFPEQFWFDAALSIGGLMVIGAGILIAILLRWNPKAVIESP